MQCDGFEVLGLWTVQMYFFKDDINNSFGVFNFEFMSAVDLILHPLIQIWNQLLFLAQLNMLQLGFNNF